MCAGQIVVQFYNSIILANTAGQRRLSAEALAKRVEWLPDLDGTEGTDLAWRLRRMVLRPLPVGIVTQLSRLNYTLACALAKRPTASPATPVTSA